MSAWTHTDSGFRISRKVNSETEMYDQNLEILRC